MTLIDKKQVWLFGMQGVVLIGLVDTFWDT